jgi:peptidyl-prolyl cis-trans isomerase A (cyclophilin A)
MSAQSQQSGASAQAKPKTSTRTSAATTYDPLLLHPDRLKAQAPETFNVVFVTTKGNFTLKVTRAWAPLGVDRFYNLVRHRFFDNSAFFRVEKGFVVQFGLDAYPAVSGVWKDAKISDDPVTQSNLKGYITFATAGANTRTTQVYINLKDNVSLDRQGFAPFGQVTDGMDVVEAINGEYRSRPDQDRIQTEGNAYLKKEWPNLDFIKTARVVPNPTAAKPATAVKKPQ